MVHIHIHAHMYTFHQYYLRQSPITDHRGQVIITKLRLAYRVTNRFTQQQQQQQHTYIMYKTSSHIKQHYSQHQSHHITSHQLSINKHLPLFRFKHIAYKLSPSPHTSTVTHHHSIAINITNKLKNINKTILNCTHTHTTPNLSSNLCVSSILSQIEPNH